MSNGGATARSASANLSRHLRVSGAGITAAFGRPSIAVILCVAGVAHLAIVLGLSLPRYRKLDFSTYYTACIAIRQGQNPYRINLLPLSASLGLDSGEMNHIAETPTFLAAFEPLTLLSPRPGHMLWQALNLLLLGVSIWMLLSIPSAASGLTPAERWSVAGLALLYPPVAQNLMFAQTQIIILFLLVVAMRALQDEREPLAGVVIAIAGLLRAYPFLLLVFLVLRRRWSAVRWALIATAVGIVLTFAALGTGRSLSWIGVLGWTTGQWQTGRAFNVAVAGFVSRMFWYAFGGTLSWGLNLVRAGAVLAAQIGFLVPAVVMSVGSDDRQRDTRIYTFWVATAVLISPIAWPHYMVLLLIPFLTLATELRADPANQAAAWAAVADFVLIAIWLQVWAGPVMFATRHHSVPISLLMLIGEFGFLAALFGYLSAYRFARTR